MMSIRTMNQSRIAALLLAIGVACGAFGAHALKQTLSPEYLNIWEKAVFYQLIHALSALILSSYEHKELSQSRVRLIAWLLIASTVIFSGSLYLLVLLNIKWLGAITPIGGAGFIVAWLWLAVSHRSS
jgi:uncharacterized membrane protein YgdD (TMEM256/DUF423 family)